jgi:multimeric flavodoxin WrbA
MLANITRRKRVLGIVGSPRRGGNTEALVDEALRGAKEAGAHVERVFLDQLDIAPCKACDRCAVTGECMQRDDMPGLLAKMKRSHVWILGTPIYWRGPTAQFKTFLDRWYGVRQRIFDEQRVILVIPMGETEADDARCTIEVLRTALSHFEMEPFATIVVTDVWDPGEVRRNPSVLEAAYRAGQEAVTSPRSEPQEDEEQAAIPSLDLASAEESTLSLTDLYTIVGPRLVVTGAPIPFPKKEEVLIGRGKPGTASQPDVDLGTHGGGQGGVSRNHARMSHGPDGWMLEDLDSTNGTFLNGRQVMPGFRVRVRSGDVVRFGMLTLVFYA